MSIKQKLSYLNDGYYFVNLSLFEGFTSSTEGGAVILTNAQTRLFVYFCYFQGNHVYDHDGGSICVISNDRNSFSISYSYGYDCDVIGEDVRGCMLYSYSSENKTEMNDVTLCSFVSCAKEEKQMNGIGAFLLSYGTQQVSYLNSSCNKCYLYSGSYLRDADTSSNVKYSSYSNCSSYDYTIIFFVSSKYDLYNCNVIYNKVNNTNRHGIVCAQDSSTVTFTDCNIHPQR